MYSYAIRNCILMNSNITVEYLCSTTLGWGEGVHILHKNNVDLIKLSVLLPPKYGIVSHEI